MSTLIKLRWMALAVPIVLSACGVGGGANTPSVRNAILAAEERGDLPKLNQDDTLTGVDADGNGVRDDVDAYIDKLPDTPAQKAALRQASRALTSAITVDISNRTAVQEVGDKFARDSACRALRYDGYKDGLPIFLKKGDEMEKININTRNRLKDYARYNQAAKGADLPGIKESSCD